MERDSSTNSLSNLPSRVPKRTRRLSLVDEFDEEVFSANIGYRVLAVGLVVAMVSLDIFIHQFDAPSM